MTTSVNYSKGLLAASQAAEQSYGVAHRNLKVYCEKEPAQVSVSYAPGCGGIEPNENLKLAEAALKDLESRHKVFQSCIRKALTFPNPADQDAKRVFDLLQISQFYQISLLGSDVDQKSDESQKTTDLLKQSLQAVPKISEFARASLVAIGAALKNARS